MDDKTQKLVDAVKDYQKAKEHFNKTADMHVRNECSANEVERISMIMDDRWNDVARILKGF